MKKKTAVLLSVIFLVFTAAPITQARSDNVSIQEDVAVPFYQYISVLSSSLSIGKTGKAVSSGYVYYPDAYDSTLSIELQRKNGSNWSVVKSWSESFTGKGSHSLEEEYYVTSGNTYRVVSTAKIKDGSKVLETATRTSSEVTY
ncbi:hypothetical protein EHV15_26395 [Paenibacillus oralis]|uniref:DUF5626 domain-containing protein n=1 Tax=Paenibacillus oralis TaxID=2490856 RepID=A0A3P3U6R2_9BACL|nr:hypothetical protein [Paenibacillus oralis]RRJ66051.1 hypothetical protein EHV15_26395 [Paenibacillus oralis]